MEDIFSMVREGNAFHVRVWLDNIENDLNQGDDHGFSPLHWASREGHYNICEMLLQRGARVNAQNMGDDTPLHLAVTMGKEDVMNLLIAHKASINAANEHGNTPIHYAAFWGHEGIAETLVQNGALVTFANKYGQTPLDRSRPGLKSFLQEKASALGQDVDKVIAFKDQNWRGTKTLRSTFFGDATLSRHSGIDINSLNLQGRLASNAGGDLWKGRWQEMDIAAKILHIREITQRTVRDFQEEYPRLRIFSHQNVLPVIGACTQPPNLVVIGQYMPNGSLFNILHEGTGLLVDQAQALKLAIDLAHGMAFLHSLDPLIQRFQLTSRHVLIDEDMTARINMGDAKFSFQEKGKSYAPAWSAPEALRKSPCEINVRSADMWSFAVLLWELQTREVPFAGLSNMEIGMKVSLERLRLPIPPGLSPHMTKLIRICMNEEPTKRPKFDMILPILQKMHAQG